MLLVEVVKALGGLFKLVTLTSKTVRSSKLTRIDPTHLINGPYSNCWLSRTGTVSETYGDFSRKCEFSTALSAPAKGVPLGTGAWGQKIEMMGLPGRKRSLTIPLAVWLQYPNVTNCHKQTDGRMTAKTALTHSVVR